MYHKSTFFLKISLEIRLKRRVMKVAPTYAAHLSFYFAGFSNPRSHRPSDESNQPCFPYIWVIAILPQFVNANFSKSWLFPSR